METSLTEDVVGRLLRDPDCPYALHWEDYWNSVRSADAHEQAPTRVIEVEILRRFAEQRCEESVDDRSLDRAVERLGGRRSEVMDPWSAPRRLLRRLAGRPNVTTDVYEIPRQVT
ncbi:MAG: hypothetical protein QOE11_641 [Solirubrobacteraceae bacterium]|jgi:hypothetical protein|nr:hypothetical protein [Solirubrobacteraceae bacterium]